MSNTNTYTFKRFKPSLVLHVGDFVHPYQDTRVKGTSKENPLKLSHGFTKDIWLSVERLDSSPDSQKYILPEEILTGGHWIYFDPDKKNSVRVLLQREPGDTDTETKDYEAASTKYQMELPREFLKPGLWRYQVIGPINFTLIDQNQNPSGPLEIHVDLSFWFDVEQNGANLRKSLEFEEKEPAYYTKDADGKLHPA